MTKLLVSVRDAAEAESAWAGGADLIDVKEPMRGSLGAADPDQWLAVASAVPRQTILSAALGELRDSFPQEEPTDASSFESPRFSRPSWDALPAAYSYVKFGLARCAGEPAWRRIWRRAIQTLPSHARPVAVAYADWRSAEAPSPETVIDAAGELGCAAWLLDTFDKRRGGLLEMTTLIEMEQWMCAARAKGMFVVLAGSLSQETIPRILTLAPDYVAVRGAACRGDRTGTIDPAFVRTLRDLIHKNPTAASPAPTAK